MLNNQIVNGLELHRDGDFLCPIINNKPYKKIVIQDGVFGLRYIEAQKKLFGKIKFIIVVRNPLDVYVALKN